MFAADRWALAFTAILPQTEEAEHGLALLKTFTGPLSGIHGLFSGVSVGTRLDRMLHAALGPGLDETAEKVCRFTALLVRRGRYRYVNQVIGAIGKRLDEKKGIVPVRVDSAFPLEAGYAEKLSELLKKQTGAREIRLENRVMPELLGGCRLQIGSESLDGTLRAQLQQMTEDLALPPGTPRGNAALGGL